MGGVLNRLIGYAVEHFAAEKRVMEKHGFPGGARTAPNAMP